MQSNLEGFFNIRPSNTESSVARPRHIPGTDEVPILEIDDHYDGRPEPLASDSRNALMSLLSGKPQIEQKRKRGRPRKEHTEQDINHLTSLPVTLKISPDKLRLNCDHLNSKKELKVTLKFPKNNSKRTESHDPFIPQVDIVSSEKEEEEEVKAISVRDILSHPKPLPRAPPKQLEDVEILSEKRSRVASPAPFKSKVSASSVLQKFKDRQQEKRLKKADEELSVSTLEMAKDSNANSFFKDVQERALVSKLMKEKGINKPMDPPILRKQDFLIVDEETAIYRKRSVNLPPRKTVEAISLDTIGVDPRFGPNKIDQASHCRVFNHTHIPLRQNEVNQLIQLKIVKCKNHSRLVELSRLSQDENFQLQRLQNNSLYCNLFKPRNHQSLLVPSKKLKQLNEWFQSNFTNLPKKKPNRAHLFKKNQEEDDYLSEMDSFIVKDYFSSFLSDDQNEVEKDTELPVLIITGDHGSGKTAAIELILKDLNAYVYNLDSCTLDKKETKEMAVHQKYDKHTKQDSCILFDEIPEDEETFFTTLRGLLMVTRKPIVLTLSNEDVNKLPHWLNQCTQFEFHKVNEKLLLNYLSICLLMVGVYIHDDALSAIIQETDSDLRRCINEVQLLSVGVPEGMLRKVTVEDDVGTLESGLDISSLEQLDRAYYLKSLEFDLERELPNYEDEEFEDEPPFKHDVYQRSTEYFNSRNTNKYSRRLMSRTIEFNSNLFNLNTKTNWNRFRLEFYEHLRQMALVDIGREPHGKRFDEDPSDLLELENSIYDWKLVEEEEIDLESGENEDFHQGEERDVHVEPAEEEDVDMESEKAVENGVERAEIANGNVNDETMIDPGLEKCNNIELNHYNMIDPNLLLN